MRSRQPPRVALALLEYCLRGNDALIGDVLEDWPRRSTAWFWRQALVAVFAHGVLGMRTNPRLTTERVLIAAGMLALLGFYTVVIATLMNRVIALSGWIPQTGRYQDMQLYFTIPAFAGAVLMGCVIGRLHRTHRVVCALGCGATVTIAACLNFYLFVPDALAQPLVPHPATQIAAGMICVAGLFIGISSRSLCEPQPSS